MVNVREVVFIVIAVSCAILFWLKPTQITNTEYKEKEVFTCDRAGNDRLRAACVAAEACARQGGRVTNYEVWNVNGYNEPKFNCEYQK